MHPTPIRVLHLITELDAGGAQTALLRLLEQTPRDQFLPQVACLYNDDKVVAQQIRKLGVPVVGLGMSKGWRVDALWQLYRLIRSQHVDLLHCWMFHANVVGRLIGKAAGVPIVITSRRSIHIGGAGRELVKRWTAPLDDKIIAVCELARQAEIANTGVAPEKVVTVYNGIDSTVYKTAASCPSQLREELGIPADALVVGTVGRLHPAKGYEYLIQAWPMVQQQVPQAKLLIVGDGELRTALREQVHNLQLDEQVLFTGTRSDIPELLSIMDLFVLPSLWEGMPNVILEAMAAEVPVIATPVGGVPEVIVDPAHGLLVPAKDAAALATATIQVLQDATLRQQMGRAGSRRVEQDFSIQRTVATTLGLYAEQLARIDNRSLKTG